MTSKKNRLFFVGDIEKKLTLSKHKKIYKLPKYNERANFTNYLGEQASLTLSEKLFVTINKIEVWNLSATIHSCFRQDILINQNKSKGGSV